VCGVLLKEKNCHNTTILVDLYICDSAVLCVLQDQLASLDRHVQLTRCFSAVAELLVYLNIDLNLLDYHVCGAMLGRCQKYTPKRTNIALLSIWNDLPQIIDNAIAEFKPRGQLTFITKTFELTKTLCTF